MPDRHTIMKFANLNFVQPFGVSTYYGFCWLLAVRCYYAFTYAAFSASITHAMRDLPG